MKASIGIFFSFLFCLPLIAGSGLPREHKIALSGLLRNPQLPSISVEQIKKDFNRLGTLETGWRVDKKTKFEGISLKDFVLKYGSDKVSRIRVSAINDYSQILTKKDWEELGAFMAFQVNGKIIPTKDKGTFRIIYNFEKFKNVNEVKNLIEANAVWQINRIEFLE